MGGRIRRRLRHLSPVPYGHAGPDRIDQLRRHDGNCLQHEPRLRDLEPNGRDWLRHDGFESRHLRPKQDHAGTELEEGCGTSAQCLTDTQDPIGSTSFGDMTGTVYSMNLGYEIWSQTGGTGYAMMAPDLVA